MLSVKNSSIIQRDNGLQVFAKKLPMIMIAMMKMPILKYTNLRMYFGFLRWCNFYTRGRVFAPTFQTISYIAFYGYFSKSVQKLTLRCFFPPYFYFVYFVVFCILLHNIYIASFSTQKKERYYLLCIGIINI